MVANDRTFSAIKYLTSKDCKLEFDPASNFYSFKIKIKGELGQCINEMAFEHHFCHDKSVLISFIGNKGSKIFWKTPELDNIRLIEIEQDKKGIISSFCQTYLMQGSISGIQYGNS